MTPLVPAPVDLNSDTTVYSCNGGFSWLFLLIVFEFETRDFTGFPGGSGGKESAYRRPGFNPWVRKSPGEGNGYLLQYSCLENLMDRGAWVGYNPLGCKELDMTEQLAHMVLLTFLSLYVCVLSCV